VKITDLPARYADNITIHPVTGCWLWGGAITDRGYGTISEGGKTVLVHRQTYRFLVAPIPRNLVLDHVRDRGCLFRHCCFPLHTEPVTNRVNILRGDGPTAINAAKDECIRGHPFDLYNTIWRGPGGIWRECRACIPIRKELQRQRESGLVLAVAA